MTHPSKRKGNDFERELVNKARAVGIDQNGNKYELPSAMRETDPDGNAYHWCP